MIRFIKWIFGSSDKNKIHENIKKYEERRR
jgi:hypothetical protein